MTQFSFHSNQFSRIFPFYILLNRELEVVETGTSIRKLMPNGNSGSFNRLFELFRPQLGNCSYEQLAALSNQLVMCRLKNDSELLLRGQLEVLENGCLLFLGSPWFGSMDEVKEHQLNLHDFAYHDSLIDLLHVVRTQEIAAQEVRELYDKVKAQSQELKVLAEERASIALFPFQNPDPVFRIDREGNLLMKNNAAEELFREQLQVGDTVHNFSSFCRLVVTQLSNENDRVVIEAGTPERFYSFSCILLPKDQYINVYGRNLSDLKQLELRLIRSATRFTHLIANMQAGVLMEDENRTILLTNQYFCDLFSIPVPPDALIGADCSQAVDQFKDLFRDPEQFVKRIDVLLQQRALALGDRLELTDGRVYRRDFVPIWNGPDYLGHLWMYEDITLATKAQEALEKQKGFYENILNNIPADVAVFDAAHHYIFLNPSAVKDSELRQWLIGKNDEAYAQRRNKASALFAERKRYFEKVKQTKKLQTFIEAIKGPDGQLRYHLRNLYPVLEASGTLQMVIGYGVDITDRKRIEDALSRARKKTIEEAAIKERFFAAMSHEIRTPLNGILGLSELLSKSQLSHEQQKLNDMLHTAGHQLLRIVNEVLDFEKIANGKIQFEELPFDIIQQLKAAAELFRVKAGSNQLLFNSSQPSFIVKGDPHRLNQVINNLLSNAVKFTEKGIIQLNVQIENSHKNTADIIIEVKDTGIGIEREALSKIFNPYMQAKNNIARQYGGTGLGLTITRQLIELQGGTIDVTSEPGVGSLFTIKLQLPVAEGILYDSLKDNPGENFDCSRLRILVAEDAEINRYLLQSMLESKGCFCRFVVNGAEACRAVQEEPFDLVLMDVEMPEMDGLQATACIRSLPGPASAVPIIAVTANAMKGDRELYLQAGMNDYLTKPFSQKTLEEVITRTLRKKIVSAASIVVEEQEVFDFSYLNSVSNDPSFLVQMIQLFLKVIPEQLEELNKAVQNNDASLVASILHKMRPSLEVVGAGSLVAACRELEGLLKNGSNPQQQMSRIRNLIDNIHKIVLQLDLHLKKPSESD